jgi:type II secretory pathway pseudopilin PulG
VEVIVVLVILAILMAIAVPTLTGYIDKARDKELEMRARDLSVAMQTVLNETYGAGQLNSAEARDFIESGDPADDGSLTLKRFTVSKLSQIVAGGPRVFGTEAWGLVYGPVKDWTFDFVYCAPKGSDATLWTADAFYCYSLQDVQSDGTVVYMSYGLTRADELVWGQKRQDFHNAVKDGTIQYDPNAGYEIYHLTK